jgi:hypothetical protein
MKLNTTEQLINNTIRIETLNEQLQVIGTGTGFMFDLKRVQDQKTIQPFLITNKHVVEGGFAYRLVFSTSDIVGNIIDRVHYPMTVLNSELPWKMHPEPDVDLCAIQLAPLQDLAMQRGVIINLTVINASSIPTSEYIEDMGAIEKIIMIGYPKGLWDEINNKPIVRTGITATHFRNDYKGKKEFLIDCAVYHGSSGSPIFLYDTSNFTTRSGEVVTGVTRLFLLGILYSGPVFETIGEIKYIESPVSNIPVPAITSLVNLGTVIKSEKILDFRPLFNI